jgi:CheY-like chemotaxis protein
MGGRVELESVVGKGSTFWIDVPLHDGVGAGAREQPAAAATARVAAVARRDKPLALVVEDEAKAQELLVLLLEEHGYQTVTATTAEEALGQARKLRPEVITLDVFLPTVDGWDVLRLLKTDPEIAEIPVVMVTVSNDRGKAYSLGAMEHLVKPVGREQLLEALGRRGFVERVRTESVRVLAIDDDEKQLELYRAELEPRGFKVRVVTSGAAGIEVAKRERVDVVLLDLVMPEMSGVEVVARLRGDERTRGVPILLVTAHQLSESERARLGGDVQAVVSKGAMTVAELPQEIAKVLRR